MISAKLTMSLLYFKKIKKRSKYLYTLRMFIFITVILQDLVSLLHLYSREIIEFFLEQDPSMDISAFQNDIYVNEEENRKIFLGWLIFKPYFTVWVLELVYLLLSCWILLSVQYWVNYEGLTKRQVLAILFNKVHRLR